MKDLRMETVEKNKWRFKIWALVSESLCVPVDIATVIYFPGEITESIKDVGVATACGFTDTNMVAVDCFGNNESQMSAGKKSGYVKKWNVVNPNMPFYPGRLTDVSPQILKDRAKVDAAVLDFCGEVWTQAPQAKRFLLDGLQSKRIGDGFVMVVNLHRGRDSLNSDWTEGNPGIQENDLRNWMANGVSWGF